MTQPKASPETMARLCEAVDECMGKDAEWAFSTRIGEALKQYRAETTPPLRSRAAKALDLLETLELYMTISETSEWSNSLGPLWTQIEEIVGEPTAPEPAPEEEPDRRRELEREIATLVTWDVARSWGGEDQHGGVTLRFDRGSGNDSKLSELCLELSRLGKRADPEPYRVHDLRNTFTSHDYDTREERPCGCEEAEALKDQLVECKRLLAFAHERAREIVQALGGVVP
jgi:hypothetical protein